MIFHAGQWRCGSDKGQPQLLNKMSKVWQLFAQRNKTEKTEYSSIFSSIQVRQTRIQFIETTWSLTGRGRRSMKSQIIESP